jgi:hypothetical protein
MAVRLLAPWCGFAPGDAVERGPEFDEKAVARGVGERVTITITPLGKAVSATKPKEKRDERQ